MYDPADFPDPTIVAVNGVELEVFEAGHQHAGNPIVLCHGWPEHASPGVTRCPYWRTRATT